MGLLINTLPVRIDVSPQQLVTEWLSAIQSAQGIFFPVNAKLVITFLGRLVEFEHTPLTKIHSWSEIPHGASLFDSIVVYENYPSSPEGKSLPPLCHPWRSPFLVFSLLLLL